MLTDQDGQVVVAQLGYPRAIFEWDFRVRGSVDFLANDRLKLEAKLYDPLNKVDLVCRSQQAALSDLVLTSVRGQALVAVLQEVRNRQDAPRVLSPDQVLSAANVAAIHNWWWQDAAEEDMDPLALRHVVTLEPELFAGRVDFHHVTVAFQKIQAKVLTEDLQALGDQATIRPKVIMGVQQPRGPSHPVSLKRLGLPDPGTYKGLPVAKAVLGATEMLQVADDVQGSVPATVEDDAQQPQATQQWLSPFPKVDIPQAFRSTSVIDLDGMDDEEYEPRGPLIEEIGEDQAVPDEPAGGPSPSGIPQVLGPPGLQ